MSDETKIEDEDTEDTGDVEAHGRVAFGRPSEADDDSEDVEAHGAGSPREALLAGVSEREDADGDDDVQAHIRLHQLVRAAELASAEGLGDQALCVSKRSRGPCLE